MKGGTSLEEGRIIRMLEERQMQERIDAWAYEGAGRGVWPSRGVQLGGPKAGGQRDSDL